MRLTRWKAMAGGLVLSAGGLMAMADGPASVGGCQPVPKPCLPAIPAPDVTQVVATAPPPQPVLLPPPGRTTAGGVTVATAPPPQPVLLPLTTAELPKPTPAPALPSVPTEPQPPKAELPVLSLPGAVPPSPAVAPLPEVSFAVAPKAEPTPTPPPAPFTPAAAPVPAVPTEKPAPVAEAKKPEPAPAPTPATAEKRLKVLLQMGDDRPRFEVRDGDEVYLKVISDRVEVKSAADKADQATMKAAGKVAFVTPGGDGTCDSLEILPGSGQVVAVGNVAFRHTWGRSETTVSAERMTFRLAHPGPTAIQAGYTPAR